MLRCVNLLTSEVLSIILRVVKHNVYTRRAKEKEYRNSILRTNMERGVHK